MFVIGQKRELDLLSFIGQKKLRKHYPKKDGKVGECPNDMFV